eukprot:1425846-Pleurochrysis_carterae.AAC.5
MPACTGVQTYMTGVLTYMTGVLDLVSTASALVGSARLGSGTLSSRPARLAWRATSCCTASPCSLRAIAPGTRRCHHALQAEGREARCSINSVRLRFLEPLLNCAGNLSG